MKMHRIALFGHRYISSIDFIEKKLTDIISEMLETIEYIEVLIGRNGDFDVFGASALKQLQKTFGKERILITLVLPYVTKDIEYYEKYYDAVIIPDCLESLHPKSKFKKRNEWIIDNCELLICFVEQKYGGAYTAFKYAEKHKIKTINIAEY